MRNNNLIGIIGHFGGKYNFLDGQTIKTKILYEELLRATEWKIIKVDTYYKSHNPLKLMYDTTKCLLKTNKIFVLLSGNGMKFYFPLLSFCANIFKIKVYHDVIGGNLDTYIIQNPKFVKYLNSFIVNWVETEKLKYKISKLGINNCEVMPNFKRLSVVNISKHIQNEPYTFCIFSRIMKEKGIEIAIDAIESINNDAGRTICRLDIYGRVDEKYKDEFDNVLKKASKEIAYKGAVSYCQSVETIREYYALLFPTYWKGEGFPGTIIDAFSAGLPVVASDWNCNSEIIDNKVNGILFPNEENKDLKDSILWMINNKEEVYKMKKNCIVAAKKYQPDSYIKRIIYTVEGSDNRKADL